MQTARSWAAGQVPFVDEEAASVLSFAAKWAVLWLLVFGLVAGLGLAYGDWSLSNVLGFLGIAVAMAGFGGAIVGLAAAARTLTNPAPRLEITVAARVGSGGFTIGIVHSSRGDPARGIQVMAWLDPSRSSSNIRARKPKLGAGWVEEPLPPDWRAAWRAEEPLHRAERRIVAHLEGSPRHLLVMVLCSSGDPHLWIATNHLDWIDQLWPEGSGQTVAST